MKRQNRKKYIYIKICYFPLSFFKINADGGVQYDTKSEETSLTTPNFTNTLCRGSWICFAIICLSFSSHASNGWNPTTMRLVSSNHKTTITTRDGNLWASNNKKKMDHFLKVLTSAGSNCQRAKLQDFSVETTRPNAKLNYNQPTRYRLIYQLLTVASSILVIQFNRLSLVPFDDPASIVSLQFHNETKLGERRKTNNTNVLIGKPEVKWIISWKVHLSKHIQIP